MKPTRLVHLLAGLLLAACSGSTPEPTVFIPIIGTPSGTGNATGIPATELPPAEWAGLGLSGRLQYTLGKLGVVSLDLATGARRTLFTPPADAWLTSASTSPDGARLALAYAPPPPAGEAQLGYTGLYELPGDCAQRANGCTPADLTSLVVRTDPHEAYFSPVWSLDGQFLYFAHFTPSQGDSNTPFKYTLERLALPDGPREVLVENAIWPALSPDGRQIVFVWFDPEDYSNDLHIANADGTDERVLVDPTLFEAVDAPFFSADGQSVIFSAVGNGAGAAPTPTAPPAAAWLDRLLGVGTAWAAPELHNMPSDWWRVPMAGGAPERLTNIFDTGLYGDSAPDGSFLAFISASGVYVMKPDGADVTRLARESGGSTVEWLAP